MLYWYLILTIFKFISADVQTGMMASSTKIQFIDAITAMIPNAENILMREIQSDADREQVQQVLEESGLWDRVSKFPKGMDSVLGKEFDEDGIELSGGESQKLAIARALYENAGVLILDEPANSLDPIAEAEMYERMFAAGKDRTLILISHRLYSTRKADRICYIENGKIAEEGTHEELMKANGKYAAMYHLQAGLYAQE